MSVSTDFSLDFDNQIITHVSGVTVYSVNDLYSFIQDYFDEVTSLSSTVPMSAQTPTEYTLINGWFIPEETFKFLRSGAIRTSGWDADSFSRGILNIRLSSSGYIPCIPDNIGKVVTDGVNTGILLDYNNTLRQWWIRKTSVGALSGSLSIIAGGSGTMVTSVTGENLYSNLYTLGSINPDTTNIVYVEQINPDLPFNQLPQYWNSGHVDLLMKVKEADQLIDNGIVGVYVREYGDLYAHFTIDLSSGGRNPVPLSTSTDSNNLTSASTVGGWNDVTVTFGSISRDLSNGDGPQPFDVEVDCGFRTSLSQVYERLKLITARNSAYVLDGIKGQFYRSTSPTYSEITVAPFGTYAGGVFFGARGVYLKNVPGIDVNSYKLLDSNNNTRIALYYAGGNINFTPNVVADGLNAKYSLFFKQINVDGVSRKFGQLNAILVNRADNTNPITGTVSSANISFDFDYDKNLQARWKPNQTYHTGDNYLYNSNWYKVLSNHTSSPTYDVLDAANAVGTDGPEVVLVSVGRQNAQYVRTEATITRSTSNILLVVSFDEVNYQA
jgi:hypothetical protein